MHHYSVYRNTVGKISRPRLLDPGKFNEHYTGYDTDVALLESFSVVSCNDLDETLSCRLRDPSTCSEILRAVLKISCRSRFGLPLRIPQLLLVLLVSMPLLFLF